MSKHARKSTDSPQFTRFLICAPSRPMHKHRIPAFCRSHLVLHGIEIGLLVGILAILWRRR